MRKDWYVSLRPPGRAGGEWLVRARPSAALQRLGFVEKVQPSGCRSENDAWVVAREVEQDLNAPATLATKADPTVGEVYDAYVAASDADPEVAPATRKDRRSARKQLSALPIWTLPVSEVSKAAILTSRDILKTRVMPSTAQHYFELLGGGVDWAEERGRIKVSWPRTERLKKLATKKKPLSDEHAALVLEALKRRARGRWYGFFVLQADTSSRIGAILGLQGKHLRRDTNEVFIKTKGDVEAWVAVPAETMKLIPETRPGDYVWRTAAGAKLRRETPYTVFRKCLADAGIPDPELYDSHSLRRRWITSATEDGIPLPITMAQALHTDVKHHMGYRRNAAAPSTHDAVERVRGRRVAALARLETKRGVPDSSRIWDASPESSGLVAAVSAGSYDLTS